MEYSGKFSGAWFDVGTGVNISLNDARKIVTKNFPQVIFDYTAPRQVDVMHTKADITSLRKLGWSPKHNIVDGISECFFLLKKELE